MKTHIIRMLRAMSWADRQILTAVRDCPAAQAEALPLMAHVLGAEHVWLSRLRNLPTAHPAWPTLSLDECEQLADENAAGYESFVNATRRKRPFGRNSVSHFQGGRAREHCDRYFDTRGRARRIPPGPDRQGAGTRRGCRRKHRFHHLRTIRRARRRMKLTVNNDLGAFT